MRLPTRLALYALAAGTLGLAPSPRGRDTQAFSLSGATCSTPITFDRSGQYLWAVNPDNNTVSVIALSAANGARAAEISVGLEPQSIAISRDNTKIYVANTAAGTVSVLTGSGTSFSVSKTINVGAEPWGLALTPNGTKLYVANSASNSISVIDTITDQVVKTLFRVVPLPRALLVTSDGDSSDADEKVYVASFLAQYRPGDVRPGDDSGKVGVVGVISTATDEVTTRIQLQPLADTGFKSNGDALNKIAPVDPAAFNNTTGAFPNLLASLSIKGSRVYVPATGSSPNGPVRFNVVVQGLVAAIDTASDTDANKTANLNKGVQFETASVDGQGRPVHRFVTNPYFIAFRNSANSGYLVSAASDMIVRMDLGADGTPTINAPTAAGQASNIKRVIVGKNPRAMIIDGTDTFGYVWNYVSRDVTVVDLATETAAKTWVMSNQPVEAQGIRVQRGKELFNTSIGPVVNGQGVMSDNGWCSCASCHPNGLTDGVTWLFPAGPRVSTPLNSTFGPDGAGQRALNWSAIFDEVADFELNTRGVAGGKGLILLADGVTADPNVNAFTTPSSNRNADRDSITDYLRFGIRSPISHVPFGDIRAAEGRKVFNAAGCVRCHGGPNWTISRVEFPPPPPASALQAEQGVSQLVGQLKQVGTFDATKKHEVIGNGANISKQALGQLGFNVPSLRGVHYGPYLHDGSLETVDQVLTNKTHVGNSGFLDNPVKRFQLIRFLQSIDDSTVPFNLPAGAEREDDVRIR